MKRILILLLSLMISALLFSGCSVFLITVSSGKHKGAKKEVQQEARKDEKVAQEEAKKNEKETFAHKDDYYEISGPCDLEGDERDDKPAHIGGSDSYSGSSGSLHGFSYTSKDGRHWKEAPDGHGIVSDDGIMIYNRPDGSRELTDGKGGWAQDTDKDGVYDKFGHD